MNQSFTQKSKTKPGMMIIVVVLAILMIVGWIMYALAKSSGKKSVTGLLVTLYAPSGTLGGGNCSPNNAHTRLVLPLDTCVDTTIINNKEPHSMKLTETDENYVISTYANDSCLGTSTSSDKIPKNAVGTCVKLPKIGGGMAIAYELTSKNLKGSANIASEHLASYIASLTPAGTAGDISVEDLINLNGKLRAKFGYPKKIRTGSGSSTRAYTFNIIPNNSTLSNALDTIENNIRQLPDTVCD